MWWWERCGPPAEADGLPEAQKSAFQGPWLTACLFEGPRGCWDYFRVYVAPVLSDLNRISSSIKGGLLRITFIAFQVFLETCKCPPKNWISWSELSFREILRICHRLFKSLKFNSRWDLIKANYFVKTREQGVGMGKAHPISISLLINQTCVCLTKTRVCFLSPSFSVSFDHWSGWPHAQGFFLHLTWTDFWSIALLWEPRAVPLDYPVI